MIDEDDINYLWLGLDFNLPEVLASTVFES